MTQPRNLSVDNWSDVLEEGVVVEKLSQQLLEKKQLPWGENLAQLTDDSQDILDLGSGRGELSASLAMMGKNTTLFDWSEKNLDFSKNLFKLLEVDGHFTQGDMTKPLPFDDNAFDTVFSCGVFEYFSDEEIVNIINEMKRVARKRIVILVPNARSIPYRIGKWYMERTNQWQWGGERPFKTLKPYFGSNGHWRVSELTVGTKHALKFLKIPGGECFQKVIQKCFNLKDHAKPSSFNQGYILISIGEKHS